MWRRDKERREQQEVIGGEESLQDGELIIGAGTSIILWRPGGKGESGGKVTDTQIIERSRGKLEENSFF